MNDLKRNVLQDDIESVLNYTDPFGGEIEINAILHTKDLDIEITDVISVDIASDYFNDITDKIHFNFVMGKGDYVLDVFPHKDNMLITLSYKLRGVTKTRQYRFILLDNLENIQGSRLDNMSREEMNQEDLLNITGQCLNMTVEALRLKEVSGVYRNVTVETVIEGLFANVMNRTKVLGVELNVSVNFKPTNNEYSYDHIVIPSGLKLLDLPSYLQDTDYGVYNGDIGVYFTKTEDKDVLYIYPLYGGDYINDKQMKVVLLNSDSDITENAGQTHMFTNDTLKILVGKSANSKNDGETALLDKAVGYRMLKPTVPLSRAVIVTDDTISTDVKANMGSSLLKAKEDGVNRQAIIKPTANEFKVRSTFLRNNMRDLTLKWMMSEHDLIVPGTRIEHMYVDEYETLQRRQGVISHINTRLTTDSGIDEKNTQAMSVLNVLIEKDER